MNVKQTITKKGVWAVFILIVIGLCIWVSRLILKC
jgi:hypothetical protein